MGTFTNLIHLNHYEFSGFQYNNEAVAVKIPREHLYNIRQATELSNSGIILLWDTESGLLEIADPNKNEDLASKVLSLSKDSIPWNIAICYSFINGQCDRNTLFSLGKHITDGFSNVKTYYNDIDSFITDPKASNENIYYKGFEELSRFFKIDLQPVQQPLNLHPKMQKPDLLPFDEKKVKIGQYIYSSIRALSKSGYVFDDNMIEDMCSVEWNNKKENFNRKYPLFREVVPGEPIDLNFEGQTRFYSEVFTFGLRFLVVSKEWIHSTRKTKNYRDFVKWYNSLP